MKYAAFLNLLPALIQLAEDLHGGRKSAQKLSTVVTLAQNTLLVAGSVGLIHPSLAQNIAGITQAVEKTLLAMKNTGQLATSGPSATHSKEGVTLESAL